MRFMKRKGFTLVELLAVIVVLGVIAMISVPVVLNLINESRKNSFKSSVNGMIKSVEMYYTKSAGTEVTLDLGNTEILNQLDFTGTKPTAGFVYINEDGIISIVMYNNQYCGYRKSGEESVTVLDRGTAETSGSCPSSAATDAEKLSFLGINS